MPYHFDITTLGTHLTDILAYHPGEPLMFNSGLFWVAMIIFLPLYTLVKQRRTAMMIFVTAASMLFAAKSSGWYVALLLATATIDWKIALHIDKSPSTAQRRTLLWTSITLSAGTLFLFKYGNFALANWATITGNNFQPLDLVAPIGISFYTFRTISYVADVYQRKLKPTDSLLEYAFFLSFFPCLVAGPIVRATHFFPQLNQTPDTSYNKVYGGLWLIIIGIIKKAVIADYIAQYCNIAFGNPTGYSGVELLAAIIGYAVQIYFDFSGYSDMAIGLGAIMGFDLGINFNLPYQSRNVTEFWRRWHISLSLWLRDYIYIALGGNRKGKVRQYLNLMTTMLVGGLWHGAAWTFIIWGAAHGLALCIHKACMPLLKRIPDIAPVRWTSILITFTFVATLWVFFRADSFQTAYQILNGTITRFDIAYLPVFAQVRWAWCTVTALALLSHCLPKSFYDSLQQAFVESTWIIKLIIFCTTIQLVLQFTTADVQPFIYAQF